MTLLWTLIAFGVMITIHEGGHFLMARAFGVTVETFSIGFGKPIFNFRRSGTNYRISWLPLGGYCKMKGENPDDEATDQPDAFQSKRWWQRALIAFAGPLANLILAFVFFVFTFLTPQMMEDHPPVIDHAEGKWSEVFQPGDRITSLNSIPVQGFTGMLASLSKTKDNQLTITRQGREISLKIKASEVDSLISSVQPVVQAIVGEVTPGYPAWRADLHTGDRILAVDSVQVANWYQMRERITASGKNDVLLSVQRGDSLLSKLIKLEANVLYGQQKMIGITQYMPLRYSESYNPGQAVLRGGMGTISMVIMNYYALYKLIQKPETIKSNIGGPVMIASMSQSIGKKGISALLMFFGSISIMLMIMNLLPIPILDGGHIMFCLIEGIIRRPVPLKVQMIAQRVGFTILIMLMVFAFYSDLEKLVLRFLSR